MVGRAYEIRKVALLIEGMFGIHGLFILVSSIQALCPPPPSPSGILNLPGGGTQLTRRRDASSGLVLN